MKNYKVAAAILLLGCMLATTWPVGATPQAQPDSGCIAVAIETQENLTGLLDEMGIAYQRVTFDVLKDETFLSRLCVLFVGSHPPASLNSDASSAIGRWVQRGGQLYLSGETRSLLTDSVGAQIAFDAEHTLQGDVEAEVVERGLALATRPKLELHYEKPGLPLVARADGVVLVRAQMRVGLVSHAAPLAIQFTRGRGSVLYSTLVNYFKQPAAGQALARALALRLIYARRAEELLRQYPGLPGVIQISTLTEPNSTSVFAYAAPAGQDFDVVLDNPQAQLTLSVVSPVSATAVLTATNYRAWSSVPVRAPAAGLWRIQVRAIRAASQRQPYLLLIIPRAGTHLLNSIPTPLRLSTDPYVLATNLALGLLLTCLLGLGAVLLSDRPAPAWVAEPSRVAQTLGAAGQRIAAGYNIARSPTMWNVAGPLRRGIVALSLAVYFALSALVAAMLDRHFAPTTWQGIGLFAGMFIAIGLTSLAFAGGQKLAAALLGEQSALRFRPLGLVSVIVLVLISFVAGLLPGFVYALTVGVALTLVSTEDRRRPAALAGGGVMAVLLAGLLFWALSIPTDLALRNMGGVGGGIGATSAAVLGALQALFLLIFFVALQLAFFELLPIGSLSGGQLFRWSWIAWGSVSLAVSALTMHALVNPMANALELINNRSALALAAGLAVYTLLAVGTWLTFRGRGLAGKGMRPGRGPVAALALIIGLWLAMCACGALAAAWRAAAARLGG